MLSNVSSALNVLEKFLSNEARNKLLRTAVDEANKSLFEFGFQIKPIAQQEPKSEGKTPTVKKATKRKQPVHVHGKQFRSVKEASEFFGLKYHKVAYEMKKGTPVEQIFPKPTPVVKIR